MHNTLLLRAIMFTSYTRVLPSTHRNIYKTALEVRFSRMKSVGLSFLATCIHFTRSLCVRLTCNNITIGVCVRVCATGDKKNTSHCVVDDRKTTSYNTRTHSLTRRCILLCVRVRVCVHVCLPLARSDKIRGTISSSTLYIHVILLYARVCVCVQCKDSLMYDTRVYTHAHACDAMQRTTEGDVCISVLLTPIRIGEGV
jgi:hypothetical protein